MKQVKNLKNNKDVKIYKIKKFGDARGEFYELFNLTNYSNLNFNFKQSNISISKKKILRGLHYQIKKPIGYIITVITGEIYDVSVDLRIKSKYFGKHSSLILSDKNNKQIFVPPGFAHGFLCLSNKCIINYYCTETFDNNDEYGLKWNDSDLKIKWPINNPSLNNRDSSFPLFQDIIDKKLLPKL